MQSHYRMFQISQIHWDWIWIPALVISSVPQHYKQHLFEMSILSWAAQIPQVNNSSSSLQNWSPSVALSLANGSTSLPADHPSKRGVQIDCSSYPHPITHHLLLILPSFKWTQPLLSIFSINPNPSSSHHLHTSFPQFPTWPPHIHLLLLCLQWILHTTARVISHRCKSDYVILYLNFILISDGLRANLDLLVPAYPWSLFPLLFSYKSASKLCFCPSQSPDTYCLPCA